MTFIATFTMILVIIVSNFALLRIPNQMIPWSEQSAQPFLLEFMFKVCLSLTFNFRQNTIFRHTFMILSLVCLSYKIYLRITISQLFKDIVHKSELMIDNILLSYLFLCLLAEPFHDEKFIIQATIVTPLWLVIVWYIDHYFRKRRFKNIADDLKSENDKIYSLTKMLQLYVSNSHTDQKILSEIKFSHYLQCMTFAQNLD